MWVGIRRGLGKFLSITLVSASYGIYSRSQNNEMGPIVIVTILDRRNASADGITLYSIRHIINRIDYIWSICLNTQALERTKENEK